MKIDFDSCFIPLVRKYSRPSIASLVCLCTSISITISLALSSYFILPHSYVSCAHDRVQRAVHLHLYALVKRHSHLFLLLSSSQRYHSLLQYQLSL